MLKLGDVCYAYTLIKMNRVIQVAIAIIISHYYQQFETSALTIEKELALKQQIQLRHFLEVKNEAIVIISKKDTTEPITNLADTSLTSLYP